MKNKIPLYLRRISFALLLLSFSYSLSSQVTVDFKNKPIKEALREIEKESLFKFFYSNDLIGLDKIVSLKTVNENIDSALKMLLADSEINYQKQENNIILLIPKKVNNTKVDNVNTKRKISGIIKDENGKIVIGASVKIKGTVTGAITDGDGYFELEVSLHSILEVSYLGFITQEIKTDEKNKFEITLQEDQKILDEVVVIGYGTVKKSDLTGSVATLSQKQFQNQPITRLDQAINGRVPGVMVVTNSGAPDQSVTIRVRGANSLNGGNDPLYVVDGVPNGTLFSSLDPNDIQSIEVLKDASATAIYGSRGANGVVLVATKRGIEGKTKVTFETEQSISSITKKFDMLSASEYAEFYNEYKGVDFYNQNQINNWKVNGGTDWQDLIFRTAHTQNYKLSITGGIPKLQYVISGNVLDAQGILKKSEMQRYSIRSNTTVKTTDWMNINLELNAFRRKNKKNGSRGGGGSIIYEAMTYGPTIPIKDEEGNWVKDNVNSIADNPYGRLMQDQ